MKPAILLLITAFAFTGCSRYDYYWHEEEDDVYFVSQTPEEVDIYQYQTDNDNDEEETETYDNGQNRSYDPYPNTNRQPTIYNDNRRRTRTNRRTTQPRTTPSKSPSQRPVVTPAPRRNQRPTPGKRPSTTPQ